VQQLNKIIKRKNKALGVFKKIRDDLVAVVAETNNEIINSRDAVEVLENNIKAEVHLQKCLMAEKDNVNSTIDQINSMLGTSED